MERSIIRSAPADAAGRRVATKVFWISACLWAINMIAGFKWFYSLVFSAALDPWTFAFAWPIYKYAIAFLLFFLVPWYVWRVKLGKDISRLGVQRGNTRRGAILSVVGAAIVVLVAFSTASDPAFPPVYPLERVFVDPSFGPFNPAGYIVMEALYVVLYYIPYEFFFRGFAQFPLVNEGKVRTTWVLLYTTAITTILHWDTPAAEFYSALVAGFVYGLAALKTRSIYYGLINHVAVGLVTNLVCLLVLQNII